jgi:threonylcarbamoyladenosine tRNA methylthiotransferase CDKAL1
MADGEVLAGCLHSAGFELVQSLTEAEIVVYNTCGVKAPTENKIIHLLKQVPADKRLVVAGCLPLINFSRLNQEVRFDAVVGPAFGEGIVGVVKQVLDGERVVVVDSSSGFKPSLGLPRMRVNPVIGIVPITSGCAGECSYCCVRFARGKLRSVGIDEVKNYVGNCLSEGVREFWFTGQDVACYGLDIDGNVVDLLRSICGVGGFEEFWVRLGMMTPNLLLPILDDLRGFLSKQKGIGHVFEFLHVPVQSGDDSVLLLMNRRYSVDDFERVVSEFRRALPFATVATDVIVGFPGEDEQAFGNSVELIGKVKPDIVNVSKFFARPNTPAAKMEGKVEVGELKRRSEVLAGVVRRIGLEKNKSWVGWSGRVLIDEKGKKAGSWVGRNFAYKPVVVYSDEVLLGRVFDVRVVGAFQSHLVGEIV